MKTETLPPELRDVVSKSLALVLSMSPGIDVRRHRIELEEALAALESAPDYLWSDEDFQSYARSCNHHPTDHGAPNYADCQHDGNKIRMAHYTCRLDACPRLGGGR